MRDEFVNPDFFANSRYFPNGGIYLFFILWPFGVLLYALKNYRSVWAKNIVWLYTIFFGFTYVIPDVVADAYYYAESLKTMAQPGFGMRSLFGVYLDQDSGVLDIAQRLVTFLVSRFTTDYRFLFAVFGIFMGYFISRNIWSLVDRTVGKLDFYSILVLISFSLVIGIWDIGGVRWNVAAVMFVYAALQYLVYGKTSALWIAACTIFVHWSFVIALVVLLVYVIAGNRSIIYFGLFLVSIIVADLNLDFIRSLFEAYAPAALQESRGSYLDEYYIEYLVEDATTAAWYFFGGTIALKWYLFAFAILFYTWGMKEIKEHSEQVKLFNFSLLYFGVFNLLSVIPSVMRFIEGGLLLLLAFLFYNIERMKGPLLLVLRTTGIPLLLVYIVIRMRFGFDYIGTWSILGSPIFIFFAENKTPLIDIVKDIL